MFGHAFIAFSSTDYINNEMDILEFNLEINVTEPAILEEMSTYDKVVGLFDSNYNIYKPNLNNYFTKYLDRGQSIHFYKVNATSEEVGNIYSKVIEEKNFRERNPLDDYNLIDKNCVTEVMRIILEGLGDNGAIPSAQPVAYLEIFSVIDYLRSVGNIKCQRDLLALDDGSEDPISLLAWLCNIPLDSLPLYNPENAMIEALELDNDCKTHEKFTETYRKLIKRKFLKELRRSGP